MNRLKGAHAPDRFTPSATSGRIAMRETILTAAAVAAFVSFGSPASRVEAMTVASSAALGTDAADLNSVQQVRWGWHRHYGGWRRPWIAPYWGWRRPWIGPPVYWG